MTFRSNLPPGLGVGFGWGFGFPIAGGFPPLFFLEVCLVHAMQSKRDPYLTVVR